MKIEEIKTEIVVLQLLNGDNVIGEIEGNQVDEEYVMNYPMSLMLDPTEGGIGIIPFQAAFVKEPRIEIVIQRNKTIDEIGEHLLNPEIVEGYKNYLKELKGE